MKDVTVAPYVSPAQLVVLEVEEAAKKVDPFALVSMAASFGGRDEARALVAQMSPTDLAVAFRPVVRGTVRSETGLIRATDKSTFLALLPSRVLPDVLLRDQQVFEAAVPYANAEGGYYSPAQGPVESISYSEAMTLLADPKWKDLVVPTSYGEMGGGVAAWGLRSTRLNFSAAEAY